MKKNIFYILTLSLFITSCEKKFLEVDRPGVISISTTQDYDMLLNSDDINGWFGYPLLHLSDNWEFDPASAPTGSNGLIYTWQDQPYQDTDPVAWSVPYKSIYYTNLVINEIDNAEGGTKAEKEKLKGEALLARAYGHFMVLQLYAKPYDPATAATDPGVPYLTIGDMYSKTPDRGTVKGCYEKMIADIELAMPLLPNTNTASFRGSKAAAHALLSRIYLHMREYDKSIASADAMLAFKSTVTDYKPAGFALPDLVNNPEIVYLRVNTEMDHLFSALISPDADALFAASDVRKRLYVSFDSYSLFDSHFGISVPEILLTKAEALVRKTTPDLAAALLIVNNLNAKRVTSHTDLSSSDPETVLNWVLDEKRRELLPHGVRWFDMRRLAIEGRMPTITREVNGETFTLPANSKKYTMMIPQSVINFNTGMKQNNR